MATVVVIGVGMVLSAAAAAAVLLGGVVTARHRAGAAADFAAIAAAEHANAGRELACRFAADVAAADGARLESCRLVGRVAEVAVVVRVPGPFGRLGPA